eukprot:1011745-Amphidinium_carterae.3
MANSSFLSHNWGGDVQAQDLEMSDISDIIILASNLATSPIPPAEEPTVQQPQRVATKLGGGIGPLSLSLTIVGNSNRTHATYAP